MKQFQILHNVTDWEQIKQGAWPSCGVIIFKFSPICPISRGVEQKFDAWFKALPDTTELTCVKVDVVGDRPLSQYLARELRITHESPQAIWLTAQGIARWHASHRAITNEALDTQLRACSA